MNDQKETWLDISGALLHSLLPKGAGIEVFGHGMPAADFAAMVDAESRRVDHALVALATAADAAEVQCLFSQLSQETRMVLFSRWANYTEGWRKLFTQPDPAHWFPPQPKDWWRAVFLSMTGEGWYSTETCRSLWPGEF